MEHVEMPGLGLGREATTPLPYYIQRVSFTMFIQTQARDQMYDMSANVEGIEIA